MLAGELGRNAGQSRPVAARRDWAKSDRPAPARKSYNVTFSNRQSVERDRTGMKLCGGDRSTAREGFGLWIINQKIGNHGAPLGLSGTKRKAGSPHPAPGGPT